MKANKNQLAYQEAAVRNASAIELVVMLYDILARDLHGAIEAMEAGNIEARSAKLKHGFLALQQLEGTLRMVEGGELAAQMSRFYIMLRAQMMKAQVQRDPEILQELIQLLFSVREAWVEVNSRPAVVAEAAGAQSSTAAIQPVNAPAQVQTASWKA
jgi:flagellar secretion chaperone FliS